MTSSAKPRSITDPEPPLCSVQQRPGHRRSSLALGDFTTSANRATAADHLSLRANGLASPYQDSFVEYLREALKAELDNAGVRDEAAGLRIHAHLQESVVDISSGSTGRAVVQARFVLSDPLGVQYDKVIRVSHEWESSYIAAIAVPTGARNYAAAIQKLIGTLFSDADFRRVMARPAT